MLLDLIGSALTTSLIGLIVALAAGAYFYGAPIVEEANPVPAMPEAYPAYQARTKRLIPYLL